MVRYCSQETRERERERERGGGRVFFSFLLVGGSWGGVGAEMMKKDGE